MRSSERQLILLSELVSKLGWPKLRRFRHTFGSNPRDKNALTVTWYESGKTGGFRTDFYLKVIRFPADQDKANTYEAAVFAIRYRICTPWQSFKLQSNEVRQAVELKRLRPWLARQNFDSLKARNEFRKLRPECTGYSWRKIRAVGLPNCDCLQLNEIISEDGK